MIISNSRRFTFVHISKSGGTSVEAGLEPFLAWNDLYLGNPACGERMIDAYQGRFGLHKHSSVSDIEKVCGIQYVTEYYLFSVVRNPLHRICSLYNFVGFTLQEWCTAQKLTLRKLRRRMNPSLVQAFPFLNWPATRAYLACSSFSEFLRHEALPYDDAFRTQAGMLARSSGELATSPFRLEDITIWLPLLRNRLQIDVTFGHENRSTAQFVNHRDVCSEDKLLIERIFEIDYIAFGY